MPTVYSKLYFLHQAGFTDRPQILDDIDTRVRFVLSKYQELLEGCVRWQPDMSLEDSL